MEQLQFNLQISSREIDFPRFCMEEIYVQIPNFVDRETNIHQKCSTVFRGNKIFPSSFFPYFHRYRDDKFVDKATTVENELKKIKNLWKGTFLSMVLDLQ